MTADTTRFDLRGFIPNSLLEWENHVAAVVVAGGCNLRCPYCHSWRYVTGLAQLEPLDLSILYDLLERQRGWIDGVVITGGEPTLQPGLADVIRRCREYNVQIKLHSNGTRPDVLRSLLDDGLLDCLALDYKAPLDKRLLRAAGISDDDATALKAVAESFALARSSGIEREYHTTLDPRFVSPTDLTEMGRKLEPDGLWVLQQYEAADCLDPSGAGSDRYTGAELDALETAARSLHRRVFLQRGSSS